MSHNLARIDKHARPWPCPSAAELSAIEEASALGKQFSAQRTAAQGRLGAALLPDATHELWRYTKPEFFRLETLLRQQPTQFKLSTLSPKDPLSEAVRFSVGEKAIADAQSELSYVFEAKDGDQSWRAICDLHSAVCSGAATLRVPSKTRVDAPLLLSQAVANPELERASAPLLLIVIERGAKICLVEDLSFEELGLYFPRVEIVVGDGAELEFLSVQRLGPQAQYLARHRLHCGRDVSVRATHLGVGAQVARVDLDCRMYQSGANLELYGFYLADGARHIDYHPVQEHLAPHCRSELFYKGVLKEKARSVYYGYIKVSEGAQKTDAYQANRNLLLSSEARADSIPNLNIKANDVKCSHGSSVGQVGSDELFYLMSRGLTQTQAERLLVEGFFEDLIARVKNPALQEYVNRAVLERLDGRGSWTRE